ncbi:carboxypeptidase-like regulatory domain-containing protein [Roseivirga echinicomitans]
MFRVQTITLVFLLFQAISIFGQTSTPFVVKGNVSDNETGETLPFASVFLANTTIGTVSNDKGDFILKVPKSGSYDLVIKFAGYRTFTRSIQFFEPQTFEVKAQLEVETRVVRGVTVTAKKDELWKRNLEDFKIGFLGTSAFAQQCKILNEEVLDFYFDEENNVFEAFASEPLIIENRALGYRLKYVLEGYYVFHTEKYSSYWGYPSYEELRGDRKPKSSWLRNREVAYLGSPDHFFGSLFHNRLKEEGYIVQMAKDVDGMRYLDKAELDLYQFVKPGSTENSKRLEFENILYVTYTKELIPREMGVTVDVTGVPVSGNKQRSHFFLLEGKSFIEFEQNGYVYNPLDYLVSDYWGVEKMGDLMPIDYVNTRTANK